MRVAFHAPMKPPGDPTPSGDQRIAGLIVEALERGGATVSLASAFRTYDRGDPARQARLEALGRRLAGRLVRAFLRRPQTRPDVWFTYHLYHKAPDHLGPIVAAALAIPYVVVEASHAPKQAGGVWDTGHRAAARAIGAAHRIYGFNPTDAACIAPLVRDPSVLSELAPFIDTASFRRGTAERRAARRALVAEFGFDPGLPIVLTVAMMRRDQKLASYAVLADMLGRLGARPWQILVVGDGPAAPEVRALLRRFGARVGLAGLRQGEGLASAYAGADVFAWPAVKEAFGVAFIEAAAAGLAIVAGRSGGIGRIVEDGVTGIVVDAGDAAAMARGLARLLDEPATARAMGAAAATRAQAVNDIGAASRFLLGDLERLILRHGDGGQ